jgi:hypothetical protein
MLCLELRYSVGKYCTVLDAAIQLSAKGTIYCISKWNYEVK